jgi:hypothetical protein
MKNKMILLMALLSLSSFARVKVLNCSAFVESTLVNIKISHDTQDFTQENTELKSFVEVSTENIKYELDNKLLAEDKKGIDFTTKREIPTIENTEYKLNVVNLFDNQPEIDQDDVFFGTMINTDPKKNKYITNFGRMGGDSIVLFYCKVD